MVLESGSTCDCMERPVRDCHQSRRCYPSTYHYSPHIYGYLSSHWSRTVSCHPCYAYAGRLQRTLQDFRGLSAKLARSSYCCWHACIARRNVYVNALKNSTARYSSGRFLFLFFEQRLGLESKAHGTRDDGSRMRNTIRILNVLNRAINHLQF